MVTTTSSTSTSATQTVAQNATAALLTSLGAGSGIDMTALATNLANAQFATKIDRLASQSDTLDTQISAASTLKSAISNLSTSLGERVRSGDLSPQPLIANSSVAKLTSSGVPQSSSSYSLEVTSLATAQSVASKVVPANSVADGSLTITFGTTSGGTFTADSTHTALDITVPAGSSLADVANAINAKGGGITAYVSNTTDGAKLVIKGATGEANGFKITATDTSGDMLSKLAFDPAAPGTGQLLTSAGNANVKIDGLPVTSASNTLTDVMPGVTMTLTGTNTGSPTQVTFNDPGTAINTAMADLTSALNEIASQINELTESKTGALSRDSGALALKRTFQQLTSTIIMPNAPEGTPRTLSDLGISLQKDGTFLLDTTRLTKTLKESPQAAAAMFTNGVSGVYATISKISTNASLANTDTASYGATLATSIARMLKAKTKLTEDQTKLTDQQTTVRQQMIARFSATDSAVGASKSTLSFLKNQIAAWNSSSS